MNSSLFTIVKDIVAKYGESILEDPKRLSAFFADLARDIPKPQKNAFIKCLECGFAQTLKNAPESERTNCKQQLAKRLHNEEGLVFDLCAETVDLMEAALFDENKKVKENFFCRNCNKELQEDWKICPYCLTSPVSKNKKFEQKNEKKKKITDKLYKNTWVCGKCGTSNDITIDFCTKCRKEFWPE